MVSPSMMRSFDKRADFLGRPATRGFPRRHRSQRDRRRYPAISKLIVSKRFVSYLRVSTTKQGRERIGRRGAVRGGAAHLLGRGPRAPRGRGVTGITSTGAN